LPRDEDRVGAGLDGPAGVEAEGPDLVACIEESIEVRVRGADVQRAPVHREAARVPGVTERCEHLNVADRTAQCLCLGWSGSHPQSTTTASNAAPVTSLPTVECRIVVSSFWRRPSGGRP